MTPPDRRFKPRILLLEDEAFLAMDLALTLQADGYQVLGPCRSVEEAREAVARLHPDAAVLDINLGDGADSFEFTKILDDADVPFLFVSGYSAATVPLPAAIADRPRLSKPVDNAALIAAIEALIAG